MSRYEQPGFAGQFPGGKFDAHDDGMTAGGSAGTGGVPAAEDEAGSRIPPNDPMTRPLIVSAVGSTYGATAVPVSPDDVNVLSQTDQYKADGFTPYTSADVGSSGAGTGVPRGAGNPNAPHPNAGGRGVRELGGRHD